MKHIPSVVLFVALLLAAASRALAGGGSLCCPADVNRDSGVGAPDLAIVLGAWGPSPPQTPADIDSSGEVDAVDLSLVLGSWGECSGPCLKTIVSGSVALADGTPMSNAVVVTQVGGKGVSGIDGTFSFEVVVAPETRSLTVTAVLTLRGVSYTGSKIVSPIELEGVTEAGTIVLAPGMTCEPQWLPTFGGELGVDDTVMALTVFDDGRGRGPELVVAGTFTSAGGAPASRIARWDGSSWAALGSGLDGSVFALTVFDRGEGAGPLLCAGGQFTSAGGVIANRIATWDGFAWSPLGDGFDDSVLALAVADDGEGAGVALYAGGTFTHAGEVEVNRIAKWNGLAWEPLGSGTDDAVRVLCAFDDGGGPTLYVGGSFTIAGGIEASCVAAWDGTQWSSLAGGVSDGTPGPAWVQAMTIYDDGSGGGPALIVGGDFRTAGEVAANYVAKWNGSSWAPLGSGLSFRVFALTTLKDGESDVLVAGGLFWEAGGVPASRIATWDGTGWAPLGDGVTGDYPLSLPPFVWAMAVVETATTAGPALCVGGKFTSAGHVDAHHVATWAGGSWSPLGDGLSGEVDALAVFDDGTGDGPELYAAGTFRTAGSMAANSVAKWDGATWSPLGSGMNGEVKALTVFDDGSGEGPSLLAGGSFTTAGGGVANRVAAWNGRAWSPLASGVNGLVNALAVFDDGSGQGPSLYVAGTFTVAGGVAASRIARWDGASWSALGAGVNAPVLSLASTVGTAGVAPALYVGGYFTTAGGASAKYVARWDGAQWWPLASGMSHSVWALAVAHDSAGEALYAGGVFTAAGGSPAHRIARWDGSSWSALGSGLNDAVKAISAVADGDGGTRLYVGGDFTTAGGASASRLAMWDGSSWAALGAGVNDEVRALVEVECPDGSRLLYAGGTFTSNPAGDSYLAVWGCERPGPR